MRVFEGIFVDFLFPNFWAKKEFFPLLWIYKTKKIKIIMA